MNDYLSQLAAQSLNQAEVIEPRFASLFEPLRAAGGSMAIEPLDLERELSTPAALETPSEPSTPDQPSLIVKERTTAAEMPPARRADRLITQRVMSHGESENPHGNMRALPAAIKIERPAPTLEAPASASQNSERPPAVRRSDMSATRQPELDSAHVLSATVKPNPEVKLASMQAHAPAQLIDSASRHSDELKQPSLVPAPSILNTFVEQGAAHEAVRSTIALRSEPPREPPSRSHMPVIVVAPRVVPATALVQTRVTPAPPPVQPVAPSGPAPIIRVSIGRIEVRAVMPPVLPPAPRATPPPPSLSLDDYLKQLNEERR